MLLKKIYNSRIPYEEAKKFVSFIFLQTYENIIDNNLLSAIFGEL